MLEEVFEQGVLVGGKEMHYWLFLIMHDWPFGRYWKDMVEAGVAAQHYPPGELNEARNLAALKQLRKGDSIVAAFRGHRFAGYGVLTSDFYQGGDSLEVYNPDKNEYYESAERFDCDWTVLPFDGEKPFVDCKDLKRQGHDIDLIRGLCVKQIGQTTFRALKTWLDRAGAKRVVPRPAAKATGPTMPVAESSIRWWVYKCNSRQYDYQRAWGDWQDIFGKSGVESWGSSQGIPDLAKLRQGDMVIAYQTDRNEFVGIAQVHQSCERDGDLYLTPIEIIGVKVRPLKEADPMIAAIPALQPGPVKTIYEISTHDARRLLKAAGAIHKPVLKSTPEAKDINQPPSKVQ